MMAIVIIAGVWTLVHLIFTLAKSTINDAWDVALLILFVLALILAFVEYASERPALASAGSAERFPEPAISKFFLASEGSAGLWFIVRMYVGAEWLRPRAHEPSALEILRQRYARGKIDTTTFEHMRERLEASREREQPPA
jgi:hypothetical protein